MARVVRVVLGPPQSFTCWWALSAWPWPPRRPAPCLCLLWPPHVPALTVESSGGPIHPRVCAGEVPSSGLCRGGLHRLRSRPKAVVCCFSRALCAEIWRVVKMQISVVSNILQASCTNFSVKSIFHQKVCLLDCGEHHEKCRLLKAWIPNVSVLYLLSVRWGYVFISSDDVKIN